MHEGGLPGLRHGDLAETFHADVITLTLKVVGPQRISGLRCEWHLLKLWRAMFADVRAGERTSGGQ